jgi:hypothetical protein
MDKTRRNIVYSLAAVGSISISGCGDRTQQSNPPESEPEVTQERPPWLDDAHSVKMTLPSRSIEEWPQSGAGDCEIREDVIDEYPGVVRSSYQGDEGYHPIGTARNLLDIQSCVARESRKYEQKAGEITEELLETAIQRDSATYFPYTFDFPLHGYSDHNLSAPWFSGMA